MPSDGGPSSPDATTAFPDGAPGSGPTLASVSPGIGATEVEPDALIQATFSSDMAPETIEGKPTDQRSDHRQC